MTTATEAIVAAAYARALEIEGPVGLDDDLFSLGGDSLHAIRVSLRLEREFQIEVPADLMEEPITVRAAAAWVDAQLAQKAPR